MNRPSTRLLGVALPALLVACGVTAQSPEPEPPWPRLKPVAQPQHQPRVRTRPNFEAPSATHCSRPVSMREIPGRFGNNSQPEELHRRRRAGDAMADGATSAPSPSIAAAPLRAERREAAKSIAPSAPLPVAPQAAPSQSQQPVPGPVTAGVVDDNADFTSYLAFRNRTRVAHRPRDVRDRYLLEVKDARGRGVADAEVAVYGTSGHAMWARTDAGGRVWLHPDAFDPSRSAQYDVRVRKLGHESGARLVRGQKSAVEVRLDAPAAQPRARLDLVFLIDATGSMADEIDKLKATLRTIVAEVSALPSRPDLCLGLVAYRDRGDAFLVRTHDFTDDVGGFLSGALIPLRAAGGGDYPEAMNEALHETVHELSWRGDGATRMVVLLADAPPHLDYGAPHYDDDMLAALGKGIKVFGVGASGLDKQGEFIQRQIAQYTGGRFVFLTYADARNPSSGAGRETVHDVKNYSVDTLDRLIVRLVTDELGKLSGPL
ncbi:VWA domain-containing protein [Ramlibacter sp.]|uniref:vWA domain-containing protein n=1 Tax=Ramlibacter sp. TaxID=1917967 RepID=UPI003D1286C8